MVRNTTHKMVTWRHSEVMLPCTPKHTFMRSSDALGCHELIVKRERPPMLSQSLGFENCFGVETLTFFGLLFVPSSSPLAMMQAAHEHEHWRTHTHVCSTNNAARWVPKTSGSVLNQGCRFARTSKNGFLFSPCAWATCGVGGSGDCKAKQARRCGMGHVWSACAPWHVPQRCTAPSSTSRSGNAQMCQFCDTQCAQTVTTAPQL